MSLNLTISEDLTSTTVLDSELLAAPSSGFHLNSGVYPSITVENLLEFLPNKEMTFSDYEVGTTYGIFEISRSRNDLVTYDSKIYQSLTAANIGNTPDASPSDWLETNIESLRIKSALLKSIDNAKNNLGLNKRLINNGFLYSLVEPSETTAAQLLPSDYTAWVFEPKGSDYVSFTINQIALQATTATPQSLYVINQGRLITTLTLNPNAEGRLEFENIGYSFAGKGKWIFAIDSQDVLLSGASIDPFKYDGFQAYTAIGTGDSPESAKYSYQTTNNGLSFNVSVYLDPSIFIENNLIGFGAYLQKSWELDVLKIFLTNANNRSNPDQRKQLDVNALKIQTLDFKNGTVLNEYRSELKKAKGVISKIFDTQLGDEGGDFEVTRTAI